MIELRLEAEPIRGGIMAGQKYPIEPLTEREVSALLRGCSQRAPTGIRNRAMVMVMYRCGLRVGEVLALKASDINPAAGTVRVLHGKGNRARVMGIDDGTLATVARWADSRKSLGLSRAPLFCTLAGKPVSDTYVRAMMKRLGRKGHVDKRVHAHGLRHTHAFELSAEGVPVNVISRQLGHSSSAVTARYIDHVAPQDVISMGRARTWTEVLVMTTYDWDDAANWHADPDTARDDLAEDEGPVLLYCTACRGWRWADWLCPGAYEGDEEDELWARVCESCGSWVQEGDAPPDDDAGCYRVAQTEPYMRVTRTGTRRRLAAAPRAAAIAFGAGLGMPVQEARAVPDSRTRVPGLAVAADPRATRLRDNGLAVSGCLRRGINGLFGGLVKRIERLGLETRVSTFTMLPPDLGHATDVHMILADRPRQLTLAAPSVQLLGVQFGCLPPVGRGVGCHAIVFGFEFDNGVYALRDDFALNNGLC